MPQHKIIKMHIHLLPITHAHTHTNWHMCSTHASIQSGQQERVMKFSTTKIEQFMTVKNENSFSLFVITLIKVIKCNNDNTNLMLVISVSVPTF